MLNENIFDLIIVGGGPAGASAAIYAARKRMKAILILKEWGGQSVVSSDIQNWIGTPHISGADLAKNLESHVKEYAGEFLKIKVGSMVTNSEIENSLDGNLIKISLESGENIFGKSLLITTGSNRKKIDIKGADEFEHKGLTYCATCDGPMFSDMDVVVIGGGNAGFESASQLLAYCKSVTLLSRSEPRAEKITIEKLKTDPKFKLIIGATPKEIFGDKFVNAISYLDKDGNEIKLDVSGVFVEIGQIPATDWVKNIVELDETGKIKIDPWTNRASKEELIWAAGDATNILYHQNNIASGEAVKAIEDIYKTLKTK
ncbi:MAG: dehydrogenase [Patescibacteria group bacterium]|nr:dehydrogenase [Patescibacteria group bacterium]